ncbi:MAG: glycogen/starch/alpha-glucan phosphorylase, partial [Clostridia bacterium]
INGAVTIGTMDGANIEIHERVGDENIFIFGLLAHEIDELNKNGYEASSHYNSNDRIKALIDALRSGIAGVNYGEIADSLVVGNNGSADHYKVLEDYDSYSKAQDKLDKAYCDKERWARMSLMNTANSGFFSSDRSVEEYATRIWNLTPVNMGASMMKGNKKNK